MRRGLVGESLEKFFSLLNTFTWGQKHAVVLLTQLCAEVMLVVDTGLWHPCANKPTCADTVCWGESQFKMATQEDPELTFSHQIYTANLHNKSTGTHGIPSSERKPKNQLVTHILLHIEWRREGPHGNRWRGCNTISTQTPTPVQPTIWRKLKHPAAP